VNHGGGQGSNFLGLVLTLWQLILADDPAESRGLRLWSERRRSKLSITSLCELLGAKPFPRLSAERARQMTAAKHCAPPTEHRTVWGERACPLKSRCALPWQSQNTMDSATGDRPRPLNRLAVAELSCKKAARLFRI
jgi:hypothetical protein